jgi:uncharacterized protein (UPF0332 family)
MNKRDFDVHLLLTNQKIRAGRIKEYISEGDLVEAKSVDESFISGHIEKAQHNLEFVGSLKSQFDDWKIVGSYYAMYHAALALCARAGYKSKNHGATFAILIENYNDGVFKDIDFEEFAQVSLTQSDLLFYGQVRTSRKKASYGTKSALVNENIPKILSGAKSFVGKAIKILESED